MSPRAQLALEHMKSNLHLPLTVDALARIAGMSPSGFSHLFTREIGMPPMKYLKLLRMRTASMLLESSVLGVKEIADKVGYRYGDHFMRDFKTVYLVTPSQYRTQHLEAAAYGAYTDVTDAQRAQRS